MPDEIFNKMFTIEQTIKKEDCEEIREFLEVFTDNYKHSVESGYALLGTLPIAALLGQIAKEAPDDTKLQNRFIMRTVSFYVAEVSIQHLILSLYKLVEKPHRQYQAENRSFYNFFLRGYAQGYLSEQLKLKFDALKQKEETLLNKVKNYRDKLVAHNMKDFNILSLWDEKAFSKDEIVRLIGIVEDGIGALYYEAMGEICPKNHSRIIKHGEKTKTSTDIAPKDTSVDLEILSKVYKEHFGLFLETKDITTDPVLSSQVLARRSKDFYTRIFGIKWD